MAKFIYRMQNILDIKSKLETQAKNEYAQANRDLLDEQEKLTQLVFKKKKYESCMKEEFQKTTLNLQDIDFYKSGILFTDEQIKEQTVCVMKAQQRVDRKRDEMLELRREREMQEHLKEAAFEQFVKEELAAESKEIDELVSYTYGKKQNESR